MKPRTLNVAEKEALALITNGADVYDYGLAVLIRKIQHDVPGLVTVTEAMHAPENGAQRLPYFGAILTAEGRRACRMNSSDRKLATSIRPPRWQKGKP